MYYSEKEFLYKLLTDKRSLIHAIDFALEAAFPYPKRCLSYDILVSLNIERAKIGLLPNRRPGDVDILILPIQAEEILYDYAIAIEAKIFRPTLKNPGKNVNKFGLSQALGLRRDGFPFVGLLHIALPENTPHQLRPKIPLMENKLDGKGNLLFSGQHIAIDPFSLMAAYRQEGRLKAKQIPPDISYKVLAFEISQNGSLIANTVGFSYSGHKNPFYSKKVEKLLTNFYQKNSEFFTKISWF